MEDQQQPVPIHFTVRQLRTVEAWPAWTTFHAALLRNPHLQGMTVTDDVVEIHADNGSARYQLRRDLPTYGDGIVAELLDGDAPAKLRAAGKKYQPKDEGT
jgi:hypothetical protein